MGSFADYPVLSTDLASTYDPYNFEHWDVLTASHLHETVEVLERNGIMNHLSLYFDNFREDPFQHAGNVWNPFNSAHPKQAFGTVTFKSFDEEGVVTFLQMSGGTAGPNWADFAAGAGVMCSAEKILTNYITNAVFSDDSANVLDHFINVYLPKEFKKVNRILTPSEAQRFFILTNSFVQLPFVGGKQLEPCRALSPLIADVLALTPNASLSRTRIIMALAYIHKLTAADIKGFAAAPTEWLYQLFPEDFKFQSGGMDLGMRRMFINKEELKRTWAEYRETKIKGGILIAS